MGIMEEARLRPRKISSSINKLLLKEKPTTDNLRDFKFNFQRFLSESEKAKTQNQTEENFKNLLKNFLETSFYKDKNAINTKSYKGLNEADLVIHKDKTQDSTVILEIFQLKSYHSKNKNHL